MPYPYTIPEVINIGKLSAHLSQLDVLKSSLFGRKLDPRLPLMLSMESDAVNWEYLANPTNTSLTDTSNYLYELCGAYATRAQGIISGGGGTPITPVAPNGYIYTSLAYTVTATELNAGAPVDGTTVWTNSLFIGGLDLTYILVDNTVETVGAGFTFNNVTGTITRTNPFFTGSIVVVSFLRKL